MRGIFIVRKIIYIFLGISANIHKLTKGMGWRRMARGQSIRLKLSTATNKDALYKRYR